MLCRYNNNILASFRYAWVVKIELSGHNKILKICVTCFLPLLTACCYYKEEIYSNSHQHKNIYYLFNCVRFMSLDQLIRLNMKYISWHMHACHFYHHCRHQRRRHPHCPFCFMWEYYSPNYASVGAC